MAKRGVSKSGLSKFEGREVMNVTAAIRNTGDGLSDAMNVDLVELHHGEKVYVVLECDVEKLRFDPIKDTNALNRVHMMKAVSATIVDEELVREALDEQQRRIDEANGVHALPFGGEGGEGDGEDGEQEGDD